MNLLSHLPSPVRRTVHGVIGAAFVLALASCGNQDTYPLTTLSPKGEQADTIHTLVKPIFAIAGVVFVLVQVIILVIVVKFRKRKDEVDGEGEPVAAGRIRGHQRSDTLRQIGRGRLRNTKNR